MIWNFLNLTSTKYFINLYYFKKISKYYPNNRIQLKVIPSKHFSSKYTLMVKSHGIFLQKKKKSWYIINHIFHLSKCTLVPCPLKVQTWDLVGQLITNATKNASHVWNGKCHVYSQWFVCLYIVYHNKIYLSWKKKKKLGIQLQII